MNTESDWLSEHVQNVSRSSSSRGIFYLHQINSSVNAGHKSGHILYIWPEGNCLKRLRETIKTISAMYRFHKWALAHYLINSLHQRTMRRHNFVWSLVKFIVNLVGNPITCLNKMVQSRVNLLFVVLLLMG